MWSTAGWPSLCALCHGWGRGRLCAACLAQHAPARRRCLRCALPLPPAPAAEGPGPRDAVCGACRLQPPPQFRTVAAVDYAPPWDGLIARCKFHGALDLVPLLADRLAACLGAADAPAPDWLLPAPLSAARLRERGYNQAWEIARRLAHRLRCPASAELLLRPRHGERQMALPRAARAANVRGAYAVEPAQRSRLAGRHVALVDDVMTTGASAAEMTLTLLAAGAASVELWVVARTPAPG